MQEETLLHKTREALAQALAHPGIHDAQKNAIADFLVDGTVTVPSNISRNHPDFSINRMISLVFSELRNMRVKTLDETYETRLFWLDVAIGHLYYHLDILLTETNA
jgi:hypothetical protein